MITGRHNGKDLVAKAYNNHQKFPIHNQLGRDINMIEDSFKGIRLDKTQVGGQHSFFSDTVRITLGRTLQLPSLIITFYGEELQIRHGYTVVPPVHTFTSHTKILQIFRRQNNPHASR